MTHTIKPTVYEREDGMQISLVEDSYWVLRAPVKGMTQFWNGSAWIPCVLIEMTKGRWPAEFRFSATKAMDLLSTLEAP